MRTVWWWFLDGWNDTSILKKRIRLWTHFETRATFWHLPGMCYSVYCWHPWTISATGFSLEVSHEFCAYQWLQARFPIMCQPCDQWRWWQQRDIPEHTKLHMCHWLDLWLLLFLFNLPQSILSITKSFAKSLVSPVYWPLYFLEGPESCITSRHLFNKWGQGKAFSLIAMDQFTIPKSCWHH